MLPHTHVRGKRWIYEATYPDGRTETILSVPKYDFNWQTDYVFKQPLKLPKGTKLHATAWYDNSAEQQVEPRSDEGRVRWGDQTWEEMMFTGLTFSIDPPQGDADGAAAVQTPRSWNRTPGPRGEHPQPFFRVRDRLTAWPASRGARRSARGPR